MVKVQNTIGRKVALSTWGIRCFENLGANPLCVVFVEAVRIELTSPECKSEILPLKYAPDCFVVARFIFWGERDLNSRREFSNRFTVDRLRPLGHRPMSGQLLGIEPRSSNPQFNILPLNYSCRTRYRTRTSISLKRVAFKATASTISPSGLYFSIYPKWDSNSQKPDPKSGTSTNSVIRALFVHSLCCPLSDSNR